MARDGVAALTTEGAAPGAVPSSRRRRRTAVIAGVALFAVLVSGAGYWRWSVGASDLVSYDGINQTAPAQVGQTIYVGADIQPKSTSSGHRRLEVRRVTPHITVNTADATVRVLTCTVADPHLGLGLQSDTQPCRSVAPFTAGVLDLGFPATEIIYRITASRPGVVRIEGAGVSYHDGIRTGVQHAGSGTELRVGTG